MRRINNRRRTKKITLILIIVTIAKEKILNLFTQASPETKLDFKFLVQK